MAEFWKLRFSYVTVVIVAKIVWLIAIIFLLRFISSEILAQNEDYSLEFSTYFGGATDGETMRDIFIDENNFIYTALTTGSNDLPTVGPYARSYTPPCSGLSQCQHGDVYIAKWKPDGKEIVWSTYLGGEGVDEVYGVSVDSLGNVIVSGRATGSSSQYPLNIPFPVTNGVFQTQFMGCSSCSGGPHGTGQDAFVAKYSSDGQLLWSSYFGTSDGSDTGRDVAVDSKGNIYLTAHYRGGTSTYPFNFTGSVAAKFLNKPRGKSDGVIAKINSNGTEVLWARFVGGNGDHGESSVKVDPFDFPVYVAPDNSMSNFDPVLNGYVSPNRGSMDWYLAKFDSGGNPLFGSSFGGSSVEGSETNVLAIDASGRIVVAGLSNSTNYPTTQNAFDRTYNGSSPSRCFNHCGDAVISILSSDGSKLLASTYYGSSGGEQAEGVGTDANGNIYIAGGTFSGGNQASGSPPPPIPLTSDAFQTVNKGGLDGFMAKFSPDLSQLLYSTYYGGGGNDFSRSLWVSSQGVVVTGGQTVSSDFNILDAYQTSLQGKLDAIFLKFSADTQMQTSTPSPTSCNKPGDANCDGKVDGFDYVYWLTNFNKNVSGGSTDGDFDNSVYVDGVDYVIWWKNFGG